MKAIVVVDKKWAIGKDNKLLAHVPGDLKYFKEKTIGGTIVIGRKTLESFPGGKPLPGRTNIVLTRNADFTGADDNGIVPENLKICHSSKEVLSMEGSEEFFVCGGESIYKEFFDYLYTIFVTKLDAEYEADRYFENLDENDDFILGWESDAVEEQGIAYKFTRYDRYSPFGAKAIYTVKAMAKK